ncbi:MULTISPECIES: glycosyltransferase [unclassified Streptomyces]|uniref:glycosyltransferase n=1 Tax=unclassified Streptomyces TaxID=2593676 RepID=UPI001F0435D7|nr:MULTISPECIES: nucleotide disphospho-sugar-binding domain-containing protein [unclassified Streptomyces]MCH0566878.1 glycosyltransferase [Streptomyces sp. MUM 2J]MCH0569825.1 glycosyltransferase [Streptomyces sp. MUM 136J]
MLIATTPADGHVNPLLLVARHLTRRGHKVRWYTGRAYHDKVASTGAVPELMRTAYDFGGLSKEEAFPHHAGLTGLANFRAGMQDVFYGNAVGQMKDLLTVLSRFPADVIVSDDMCYGACFASEYTGISQVWIGNSVYILGSRDTAPLGYGLAPSSSRLGRLRNRLLALTGDHLTLRSLRKHADTVRAEAGLRRMDAHAMENIARRPDMYLVGTIEAFEFPRCDLLKGTHFVGPLGLAPPDTAFRPPAWKDELGHGRKAVLVTQGTVANDVERLLVPTIRALADMPMLVVVTTGNHQLDTATTGSLPDNTRVERFVPYHWLLPHIDVMVTNGGFNGVNAALAAGVPLVVAGASEEKADVAARVKWTGAGITLGRRPPTSKRIRGAVGAVLSESRYREAAARLREEHLGHDGPRRAAELIEELIDTSPDFGSAIPPTGGEL